MSYFVMNNVCKRFGGLDAVAGLSLEIERGQIVGLIGPNGAGKTTVVNLVTGMLSASAGSIQIEGRDSTRETAATVSRLGVARTFQHIRLLPHSTVLENIVIGCHRHSTTSLLANLIGLPSVWRELADFRSRALRLLDRFEMSHLAHAPASSLSYGHQRRVEMVRALVSEPKLLLLDEPVAGMNDNEANDLGAMFRALADEGLSILLVEHNMRFVNAICDKLYVLNAGRLITSGEPAEVMAHPEVIEAYLGVEEIADA